MSSIDIKSNNLHTDKNKGTYRKANIALGIPFIGLAVAFPFQHTFLGGLLTSGCSAALVGGLADWFAVNALFRRPLGVPPGRVFRTEIVPRNRERIYQSLTNMVQDELLSKEALKNKLLQYDFSNPFVKAWEAMGMRTFEEPLTQLLKNFAPSINIHTGTFNPVIGQAIQEFSESKEGKNAVEAFLRTICTWVRTEEARVWLVRWLDDAILRYENGSTSRKFLTMFLPTTSSLAITFQEKIEDLLLEDATREKALSWLKDQGKKIAEEPESEVSKEVNHALNFLLKSYTGRLQEKIENPESLSDICKALLASLDVNIIKLKEDKKIQDQFNEQVHRYLIPLMENKHEVIGHFVREGLERYTDEMLVDLIESKAGADLQMIRINGSVVGGLAGMLIYLLNGLVGGI